MSSPYDGQYAAIRDRIYYYADLYGLPRDVGIWQLWQENRFRSSGCSGAGACGIAQFTAATADRFGVDRSDVESSLNGWGKYMAWLLQRSYINGDISLALAGYNAGEGNVQKYGGIPPFAETRNYVATIMANAGSPHASISTDDGSVPVDNSGASTDETKSVTDNWLIYGLAAMLAVLLLTDD